MHVFYAPGINGNIYTLDEKESGHCVRVLRMKKGTLTRLIDGRGNLYEGIIDNPDPRACTISLTKTITGFEKRTYYLHIAISPIKNPDRFEWFIEKCVEIGIDEITPLICKNTEKHNIKHERINNLIISAMKQSLKSVATRLNEKAEFMDFIKRDFNGVKLITHCSPEFERDQIGRLYKPGSPVVILIGPEGDFDGEEIAGAVKNGFQSAHLGTSRLRTETAGVVACHSVYFMNQ